MRISKPGTKSAKTDTRPRPDHRAPDGGFDPDAAAQPGAGIFGLSCTPDEAAVVVIPVPFEATVSYGGGTARAPRAILEASAQVDLQDPETGEPWRAGIAMLPHPSAIARRSAAARRQAAPVLAAGGATTPPLRRKADQVNRASEAMNAWVEAEARRWLAAGKRVAVLGGDHSVPLGSIAAHAERYPGLGILHLDAHADLRRAYEGFTCSHASIFWNVLERVPGVAKLVQVGLRDIGRSEQETIRSSAGRVRAFFDFEVARCRMQGEGFARLADAIVSELPDQVYLSWDIDGLDPKLCPGTGTPVPGGLEWEEAIELLRAVRRSGRRIVGIDLCEVGAGEWDANVGARLLYKMIGWMLAP